MAARQPDFDSDLGGSDIGNPYDGTGVYNPFVYGSGGGGTTGGTSTPNLTGGDIGGGPKFAGGPVVIEPGPTGGGNGIVDNGDVVFIPPVKPDPTFIPPSYEPFPYIGIYMAAPEPVQFLENDNTLGFGEVYKVQYQPSTKFGTSRTYRANIDGRISKNYFVVSIKKAYPNLDLIGVDDLIKDPIKSDVLSPIKGDFIRGFETNFGTGLGKSPIKNLKFQASDTDFNFSPKPPTRLDVLYKEVISVQEYEYNVNSGEYEALAERTQSSYNSTVSLNFAFVTKGIRDIDPDPECPEPVLAPPPPGKMWKKVYVDGQKCPEYILVDDGSGDSDPVKETINYNLSFVSNYTSELGEYIRCNYQIVTAENDILDSDFVKLGDGNLDAKSTDRSKLLSGQVNINITENYETVRLRLNNQNLPEEFSYRSYYWANNRIAESNPTDFSKWNKTNKSFKVTGQEFASGITVAVVFDKTEYEVLYAPKITNYSGKGQENVYEVRESDRDKTITISFTTQNAEFVDVYISDRPIRVPAQNGNVQLSFRNDFGSLYGRKIVYLVPVNSIGIGITESLIVSFNQINDFPSLLEVTAPEQIDVPVFSDLNVDFSVDYETFAATSVDVYLLDTTTKQSIPLFSNLPAIGSFNVNLRELVTKYLQNKKIDLVFGFIPYNRGGDKELVGNNYEVITTIVYPDVVLDESQIRTAIFEIISENLKFNELSEESKYLTHLVNFGNNEQLIISSWEEDDWTLSEKVEDEIGNIVVKNKVDSILLKLYSPLSANIGVNSTLWITKLMSNPLIETVVLAEQDEIKCPPIKGPNFSIEVDFVSGKSTAFESLDNLILSASAVSSANLVSTYLSSSLINTDELNIEYYSGSNYLTGSLEWKNFVHFSSAKERVDNFVYKVQLIEAYESAISASNATQAHSGSLGSIQETERQTLKKNQLVNNFDGFEKFLYTSSSLYTNSESSSITWPYSNGIRLASTSNTVSTWYENLIRLGEEYDSENQNYLKNNIPQYILNNNENDNFLLFFSMIGHHFDNIYYFTKALEKNKNLGYKVKGGMPDKLLFDTLKSFGWDAKNLAADETLWKYVYGQDSDGTTKESKSPKERTSEIWRRIINNLPYLLKHKGTRRGVYAIMACYGIPSSNLSILEFGGPEPAKRFNDVDEVGTTKLLMDNTTYALVMNSGSIIQTNWQITDKGEKPKTIELFTKPAYAGDWTILSGSGGWNLQISGSSDSEYGYVKFNSGSTTIVSSSLLPIFNDRFFGISLSTGSYGIKLDLKQVDKDRSIFENVFTSSINNNFSSGSIVWIGGNYSGSIDEIRFWSTPLSSSAFYKHVFFPEAINGNHISSSTEDLYFRLDFEYPKNLAQTSSLINVDTNIYFSSSVNRNKLEGGIVPIISGSTILSENVNGLYSASANLFANVNDYPYNFEVIERTISLEVPNIGSSRYSTNKVRFEKQYTLTGQEISGSTGVDLSFKSRATKKAFDQSPIDTNRIGLFFSPTKEMNIDIAKSFGGINLDDYIGDPSDEYKSNYKSLEKLRKYYFQRFDDRDIYQYINLIKSYEKSLFEDIKKMLPARVKATTGLLIEPHILERSTIKQSKPTGSVYQQESVVNTKTHILTTAETNQYETIIDNNLSQKISGETNQYEGNVYTASIDRLQAENYQYETPIDVNNELLTSGDYYQQEVIINSQLNKNTILTEIDVYDINKVIGQTEYETIGFGIYAENGYAIRNYIDKEGRKIKERIKVDLITEQKSREVQKPRIIVPSTGKADPRGGYYTTSSLYIETRLNIQQYSGSKTITAGTGSIISVKPVNGYLGAHYRNTSDLTTGMRNSYFLGSKNTSATTLDGTPPVETFLTNPNTLRVNRAGRDASEPILEIE